jgi:hypothetical protein
MDTDKIMINTLNEVICDLREQLRVVENARDEYINQSQNVHPTILNSIKPFLGGCI